MARTTIHSDYIPDNAITGVKIAENSITAREIATNAITTLYIADDSITADKLANSINTDIATGPAALPKAGGTMTGALVVTGDANPALEVSRGSANTTNVNLKYNTTLTGQLSAADGKFQISASGSGTEMEFYTNGAKRVEIDTSGNVAIGSTVDALSNMSGIFRTLDSTGGDRTVAHFGAHNYGDTGKTFINIGTEYGDGTSRIGSFNNTGNSSVLVFDTHSATSGQFTERMRIDSSGNVGIGGASGGAILQLNKATLSYLDLKSDNVLRTRIYNDSSQSILESQTPTLIFKSNSAEAMRIDSSGNIGIGTTSPATILHAKASGDCELRLEAGTNQDARVRFGDATDNDLGYIGFNRNAGYMNFSINNTQGEHMRIDSAGRIVFHKTNAGFEVAGVTITAENNVNITTDGDIPLQLNRLASDGTLVTFSQATSLEGTITVSGSTVSYNGFSGNHETSGVSTDTEIGTVCSTIDELDTYVSGTKSGQTRTDHAKIKISDTVGDTRVYGVLASYSETDNKPIVASVGIGSIKVTGACSGGDLLESNGDGTAKVQSDDIIRSKTIGKVTIGNSNASVKLVSCVLYCG